MSNANPSAGILFMDKDEFRNALKYGPCDGSREFLATKCRGKYAGTADHACPLDSILPVSSGLCNCCKECTQACQWTTDIKKAARADRRRQMADLTEYLDNE